MNRTETAQALVLAQAYDNRSFGESTVIAWAEVMSDLRFGDVVSAIKEHYRDTTEFLMPAHIRAAIRAHYQQAEQLHAPWRDGVEGDPEINAAGRARVDAAIASSKLVKEILRA